MSESIIRPNARETVIPIIENGIILDKYLYVDVPWRGQILMYYWYNITEESRYDEMVDRTTLMYVYDEIAKYIDIPDTYIENDETVMIDKSSRDSIRSWISTCTYETAEILKQMELP